MLSRQQHSPRPLAAHGEALQDPAGDEQDGGRGTDARGRREKTDRHRRSTHQEQGGDEGRLATDPVSEVTEQDRSEGPGDESDGVGRKGSQGSGVVTECGGKNCEPKTSAAAVPKMKKS